MPADDVKPGDVAYCKLRNGTSTLHGWYECGVLSYPRGEKGVVRVEVVEKLAPQLPDDRANGPAKKQLVSSADRRLFRQPILIERKKKSCSWNTIKFLRKLSLCWRHPTARTRIHSTTHYAQRLFLSFGSAP